MPRAGALRPCCSRIAAIACGATLLAVRVWPAEDYTRVTIEYDGPLTFTHFIVRDPDARWWSTSTASI